MLNATNSRLHCPAPSNACGNGGSDVPSNKWECLLFISPISLRPSFDARGERLDTAVGSGALAHAAPPAHSPSTPAQGLDAFHGARRAPVAADALVAPPGPSRGYSRLRGPVSGSSPSPSLRARARRHGHGLSGGRRGSERLHEAQGRQATPRRRGGEPAAPRDVSRGSAPLRAAQPPQHRPDERNWVRRAPLLHGDGVPRRAILRCPDAAGSELRRAPANG